MPDYHNHLTDALSSGWDSDEASVIANFGPRTFPADPSYEPTESERDYYTALPELGPDRA